MPEFAGRETGNSLAPARGCDVCSRQNRNLMSRPLNSEKDADWYACPSCGAEVRVGSRGCPKCTPGAGRKWEQESHLDGVDVPDDPEDFDYDDFVKREFGRGPAAVKPAGISWKWWLVGLLLLAVLVYRAVGGF